MPDALDAASLFDTVAAQLSARGPRIPTATYRLQFNRQFRFVDAAALVDYFAALGVSDLYASPFFRARPDSMHGYDIVDHNALNAAIGTAGELQQLSERMVEHDLGLMLDVVPNHMGIGTGFNAWWNDLLENGPSSRYAAYFDVAWRPLTTDLEDKVLLPFLGDHYGRVLERGELRASFDTPTGGFHLAYWETVLPINPRTYPLILSPTLPSLIAELGDDHDHVLELQSILTGLGHLPPRSETRRAKVIERGREKEILKRRLATLTAESPSVRQAIEASIARMNGAAGDAHSFDALDALLEAQAYRLAYWRTAAEEINYRRFFDINDLAAIRMENPEVFAATHKLVFELLADGRVTSLRVDHPDGLWDPERYFADLQRGYFIELVRRELARRGLDSRTSEGAGLLRQVAARWEQVLTDGGASAVTRPLYLVVEKILSRGEALPERWCVHGTSGYELIGPLEGLFVDGANATAMTDLYARFTDGRERFEPIAYRSKKLILATALASELNVLARRLQSLAQQSRTWRDLTLGTLTDALREVFAAFPVYRTYLRGHSEAMEPRDARVIERAIALARRRSPTTDPSVYEYLRTILLLETEPDLKPVARDFVMRFQQLTGPVVAKGLEDTSFYVYNRLSSLNEVGGDPDRFGVSVEDFHRMLIERGRAWPHSLSASTTHDTKRSEDVRARIHVLSELPTEWEALLTHLRPHAAAHKTDLDGQLAPDANEEYLLYQTIVGAWPGGVSAQLGGTEAESFTERVVAYMRKATKEAKVNTSWTNSNQDYDAAMEKFVRGVLGDGNVRAAIEPFARRVAFFGRWNSLAQLVLKLVAPGVPDFYQGSELWDLSLVDPDNRRPVDYGVRRAMLGEIRSRRRGESQGLARELVAGAEDGRIKLLVTHAGLQCRKRHAQLFSDGQYLPIAATGRVAAHVVACARRRSGDDAPGEVIAVVPRLVVKLLHGKELPPVDGAWSETRIAVEGKRYHDLFTGAHLTATGGQLALDQVLADFPVALLEREE